MKFFEDVPPYSVGRVVFFQATDPFVNPANHVLSGKLWIEADDDEAPTTVLSIQIRNLANDAWLPVVVGAGGSGLDASTLEGHPAAYFATAADIAAAIAALVGTAPGVLDTLGEISDAINDDANLYTTLVTALALKAPLASPALTGTPTVPTAAPGTNSTQAASTAYVDAAAGAAPGAVASVFGRTGAVVKVAGDYAVADVTGAAPLASPALTGIPTVPTAAPGTNNTQAASTAYVDAAASGGATVAQAKAEVLVIAVSDETTALTTGTAKVTFRMPWAFTVSAVRASLTTPSSSGTPTFDINESGITILSTKLTIDAGEKTSTTAAVAAVVSDASLGDDAEITIDIDVAGTGTTGAKIYLIGTRA